MSELLRERPLAVWCLFLAGAVVGGLSSALVQPQSADAVPQGLPHVNSRDIQEVKSLLEGISKTEEGSYVFDAPVEFKDSASMVQLQIACQPDSLEPALSVCGPAQFESAVGPSCVVLNDHGVDYPEPDFAGPALKVEGPSLFTGDPGEGNSLVKLDPVMLHDLPIFVVNGPSRFTGDAGPEMSLVSVDPIMLHPGKPELLVDGPSKFTGFSGDDPLMAIMPLEDNEQNGPAFRVEGRSLFTGDPGTEQPLVEIDPLVLYGKPQLVVNSPSEFVGKVGLITPEIHPENEPLLTVQGPVLLDPLILTPTIPMLSIVGADGATSINPYGVELLTDSSPEADVLGAFKTQQDGTTLLKTDTVEAGIVKETGGPF